MLALARDVLTHSVPMPPAPRFTSSVTWLALVAATTLGAAEFRQVRAQIHADVAAGASETYRLVVHSYAVGSVDAAGTPSRNVRPIGSIQRSVTSEELARGVLVSVMQIGQKMAEEPVLVAWVEHGEPTLELDARTARPSRDAVMGVIRAEGASPVRLALTSRTAVAD
jgi:hypothetical protein